MEEKKPGVFFQLFFKSTNISQLSVHICDPEERQLTAITLFNYQQNTVTFVPTHSHYYCLLTEPNTNTHIIDLPIPDKYKRSLSNQIPFGNFQFSAKVFFKYHDEGVDLSIDQEYFKDIAKSNLAKVRGKVFNLLESEMFFRKEVPCRMTKTFVRKPKSKKNLTDIFFRTKNGEIKRAANQSSNNFSKFRLVQSPKVEQKEQDLLPELPKLGKMNTSIEDISNCLSFLDSVNLSSHEKSVKKREIFEEKPEQKMQKLSLCSRQYRVNKKPKRQQYVNTLYLQTKSQLDQQKQTLQLLRSFNQRQLRPMHVKPKAKKLLKKKQFDLAVIYNCTSIRH